MKTLDEMPRHPVIQPVVFPGYMIVTAECGLCGNEMIGCAPVGTEGLTCPNCGHKWADFAWVPDIRSQVGHDGAWLTGVVDFTGILDAGDTSVTFDGYDDGEEFDCYDEETPYPWWVRVLAFLIVLRQLFAKGVVTDG
jgi:hypothetical protein